MAILRGMTQSSSFTISSIINKFSLISGRTSCPRERNLKVRSSVAKQQSLQFSKVESHKLEKTVGIGVLGVSGYTGSEDLPDMVAVKDAKFSDVDAVFCCLPHGITQDFRLRDVSEYEEWYGQPHKAVHLQAKLIEVKNIIIDSKSGGSGAGTPGRGAKEANLYTEIAEGIHSYGVTRHRHAPEIEQGLSDAARSKVTISFTPHLMPMVKSLGMQLTIYVEMAPGLSSEDLNQHLRSFYEVFRIIFISFLISLGRFCFNRWLLSFYQ
uniref:N-acetyl-gamma-glutamyl-phosphate reductase dimerisation domain-containing protein n=1 Tax=Daucus carota subsp. sativus TaxID=79200 RepID=A0A164VV49_DAUCS